MIKLLAGSLEDNFFYTVIIIGYISSLKKKGTLSVYKMKTFPNVSIYFGNQSGDLCIHYCKRVSIESL